MNYIRDILYCFGFGCLPCQNVKKLAHIRKEKRILELGIIIISESLHKC
jgi:hypothetical protein